MKLEMKQALYKTKGAKQPKKNCMRYGNLQQMNILLIFGFYTIKKKIYMSLMKQIV